MDAARVLRTPCEGNLKHGKLRKHNESAKMKSAKIICRKSESQITRAKPQIILTKNQIGKNLLGKQSKGQKSFGQNIKFELVKLVFPVVNIYS